MGELGGFLKIERVGVPYDDPIERISGEHTYKEFVVQRPDDELAAQGARCMECGVPFCHNGCPLGNLIPDWNDLVYRDRWQDAIRQLHATNNFPEFTGRLCPAPCEAACVLEIREGDAVTIKQIENSIINHAWDAGWVVPDAAAPRDRAQRRGRRRRAGGHGGRAAAAPRRAPGRALRARRGGRRPRALRRARLQDREDRRRAPRAAARGRGRRAAPGGRRRRRRQRRGAARAVRRRRAGHRLARAARPAGAGPRARRRALRDGLPLRAQPLRLRPTHPPSSHLRRHLDHRQGQARHRHRRRRHRRRLRGQLDPRGRRLGRPARAAARAAGHAPRRAHAVAAVAAEVPPQLRDGGGEGGRAAASRTSRSSPPSSPATGACRSCTTRRRSRRRPSARSRAPTACSTPISCCWRWASCIPSTTARSTSCRSRRTRAATSGPPTYATSVEGVFAAGDARRGQSLIVWAINEGRQCARMVDRYLEGLDREPVVVGGGDADEGPEGPPQIASPGL